MQPGTVRRITNHNKKSGTSNKNGKEFSWTIKTVEVEMADGGLISADTFDNLVDNDRCMVEKIVNGQYTNYRASIPKQASSGDSKDVMAALRLIFTEVKSLNKKVNLLLGEEAAESTETPPVASSAPEPPSSNVFDNPEKGGDPGPDETQAFDNMGQEDINLSDIPF